MKTSWLAIALYCGMSVVAAVESVRAQHPDITGYWESQGEGTVRVQQDGDYVWIESSQPCPNGGQRPFIMAGNLSGNILTGVMHRCTDPSLVTKCMHPLTYPIRFSAQVHENRFFRNQIEMLVLQIRCEYTMELWNKDECKHDHDQPGLDLLFVSDRDPALPTPTPTPSRPWPDCGWTNSTRDWVQCVEYEFGIADWPYPDSTPK